MKKVKIFCRYNNGKYLLNGNCFEEELWKVFRTNVYIETEWHIILHNHLQENKGSKHDQDLLNEVFERRVSLNFAFAEKLNLFDIVSSRCFMGDDKLGDAILKLVDAASIQFILSQKFYTGKDEVELNFDTCVIDNLDDCHKAIITQTILRD